MNVSQYWLKTLIKGAVLAGLILSVDLAFADDIKIGLRANRGIEKGLAKWQPTVDYLNSQLPGHTFVLLPYEGIDDLNAAAGRGEFDFVLTNPSSYTEMEMEFGAARILTLLNMRQNIPLNRFGSVIFTRNDHVNIKSIKDLKGKKFMAVSEGGFGGWRVAWGELKTKYNIDPYKDFSSLSFSGGVQEKIVFSVRDGLVDAGVVRTDMLERMAADGEIDLKTFRVLGERKTEGFPFKHSTQLYPEWPLATFPNVSDQLANDVASVLMKIKPEDNAAIKGKYAGWTVSLNYQSVHELLKALKVGPYEDFGLVSVSEAIRQHWVWVLSTFVASSLAFLSLFSAYWSIRKRKKLEDKIKHMASHDTLTNIPNRILLMDRLNQAIDRSRRNETRVGVLFLDLNNFKPINDGMGHLVGDQILKKLAERMVSCLRKTDTVARFGGDEFVIVIADVNDISEITSVAEIVDSLLAKPIDAGDEEVVLGASIGIALYPYDAETAEGLIDIADEAMYVAKKKSKTSLVDDTEIHFNHARLNGVGG